MNSLTSIYIEKCISTWQQDTIHLLIELRYYYKISHMIKNSIFKYIDVGSYHKYVMHSFNMCAQLLSVARSLNLGLSNYMCHYFEYASTKEYVDITKILWLQ